MKIVVDANIFFLILIRSDYSLGLLFDENLELYAPQFIFEELLKHKKTILEKTKRSSGDYERVVEILSKRITLVADEDLLPFLNEAKSISPDQNDSIYFALCLKLDCPLWSHDKILLSQGRVKILDTSALSAIVKRR